MTEPLGHTLKALGIYVHIHGSRLAASGHIGQVTSTGFSLVDILGAQHFTMKYNYEIVAMTTDIDSELIKLII